MIPVGVLAACVAALFLRRVLHTPSGAPGRSACRVAAIVWALYAVYEGVYITLWMRTVSGAPIRVDLLLWWPLIVIVGVVATLRSLREPPDPAEHEFFASRAALLDAAREAHEADRSRRACILYRRFVAEYPGAAEVDEAKTALARLSWPV